MIYLLEMLLILLALMFTYSTASWLAALAGMLAFLFLAGRKRYSVLAARVDCDIDSDNVYRFSLSTGFATISC